MTREIENGWLSTGECADQLGVSPGFVRGEIRDGRLCASRLQRPGKRLVYRVASRDFKAYLQRHWRTLAPSSQGARSARSV